MATCAGCSISHWEDEDCSFVMTDDGEWYCTDCFEIEIEGELDAAAPEGGDDFSGSGEEGFSDGDSFYGHDLDELTQPGIWR